MGQTRTMWTAIAIVGLCGCGAAELDLEDEDVTAEAADDGKYEAWNSANNPAFVDNTFVYEVSQLPLRGEAKNAPWPGDYWATAKDSINYRWDGNEPSPAEKVEKAFNLPGFAKSITDNFGIYAGNRRACKESSECTDLKDGSTCVQPRDATGEKPGRCIPGWWGICHGWAPAAFAEPTPVKPVEKNGVTFYPGDVEALTSFVYGKNLPTKFLSSRCNRRASGQSNGVSYDNQGRIREGECRDMNPGSWHVLVTNMLGARRASFVYDRTALDEVWNQPVRSYSITNLDGNKLKEITKAQAIALLGQYVEYKEPVPAGTTLAASATKAGTYTAPSAGQYIFRATADDVTLYFKKGAEPTDSEYDETLWYGGETQAMQLAAGEKVFWLAKSNASSTTPAQFGLEAGFEKQLTDYIYNQDAKKFFHVEMSFQYITESRPARTSHITDVDSYTRTENFEYILEADANGRIVGGEWLGSSRASHPDFAWWPSGKPTGAPAGLSYSLLKELIDKAAQGGGGNDPQPEPTATVLVDNQTVSGSSIYKTIGVPGGKKLTVFSTGSGNIDLYVKLGRKPTLLGGHDCKSTGSTSEETCSITAPPAGGTYYVRVKPRKSSTVTVSARIE